MSFDEEWAQLAAPHQPSTRMRLNELHGDGGGFQEGGKTLNVTASVLRGRAGKTDIVCGQFMRADNEVMTETGQVSGSLKGFSADKAIATFQERWRGQMSYVKGQFAGAAKALRGGAESFTAEDKKRANELGGTNSGDGQHSEKRS